VTQVFDLDACCWYPEMYMLFGGGGAPFKKNNDNTLTDASGAQVRLLGDVAASWAECDARMKAGESLLVGVASRSDEPSWACVLTSGSSRSDWQ
jgi:magnesium-dependent phosphatase 1